MARTPLARWVESTVQAAHADEQRSTRQAFLRDAGALALAVTGAGTLSRLAHAAAGPRIVVVGGGLAGLTCAYRLKQAGYRADVYEATGRVGGRCWTIRGVFDDGQLGEHGGEFIDTGHREIRRLARELDLELDDVNAAEAPGVELTTWFDGQRYSLAQATADIQSPSKIWRDDTKAAGYPTLYNSFTQRGFELDQMSVAEYLDQTIPGGRNSKLAQLLDVAYNIEYGAETNVQSALNFLYLIGFVKQTELALFGESDERFHVRGGNDLIADRLAGSLQGQISLGWELVGIEQRSDGAFRLSFDHGPTTTVVADKVVLALPFSVLRSSVDYASAGFKARKRKAIEQQGMATNSKLHVQFTNRRWENLGFSGETYSDRGYQSSWEVSRAQPGRSGILVDYTGGTIGATFDSGTPAQRANQFLNQIEPVLPGVSARWNGKVVRDHWLSKPFAKGSYSYWKVGQYTSFAGVEREPEGNCHFAGEHTSIDAQGYLNGAVETGERAADEVIAGLRLTGAA